MDKPGISTERQKRLLISFLLVAILLLGGNSCINKTDRETLHLTIVHTNDVEGAVDPCECTVSPSGGARRRATVIKELRGKNPGLLLVDSGDALFGSDVGDATAGLAQIAVMNALQYDAAVFGDRDFIYGLGILENAIHEANFPFLSANIEWAEDGRNLTQASITVVKDGVRIAIFGLTSTTVQKVWDADPDMRQKLRVLDPVNVAQEIVPDLKKNADAVILLSHLGAELDRRLASQVPGITAIIGGHSRELIHPPEMLEGGVPLVQMGYDGDPLGVLSLEVNAAGKVVETKASMIRLSSEVPSDPSMSLLVAHFKALAVLSGDLPVELGLPPELPLDVRKANQEIKHAYLVAMAFPDILERETFPGEDPSPEKQTLLDCFMERSSQPKAGLSLLTTALAEPACINNALLLIKSLPLITQQSPVIPFYWIEPGDAH